MAAKDFKNYTFAQFAGDPEIVKKVGLKFPHVPMFEKGKPMAKEAFLTKYQASYSDDWSYVFDGGKVIASFRRGNGKEASQLCVLEDYRKQGIASELLYQAMVRTKGLTTVTDKRTEEGQVRYKKVYERIIKEAA